MPKEIAWIGYDRKHGSPFNLYEKVLKAKGINVRQFPTSKDGLKDVLDKNYPLVLVSSISTMERV